MVKGGISDHQSRAIQLQIALYFIFVGQRVFWDLDGLQTWLHSPPTPAPPQLGEKELAVTPLSDFEVYRG